MNKSKKALAQYLKLNYGLRYNKNGSFILSDKPISEGELKLEKYTDQILIYEPIQNNPWDLFADEFTIKNDDNSLEFETLLDKMSLLAKTDIKLLIPTLKITYFGELIADVGSSIDRENYQEFLPREVLVGGFLIIRNAITYNPLEFDRLKAHISWSINEARWKWNLSKPEIMDSEFKNIEDSNGNPIRDMKTLTDYLNQLYKFETATVIAYEKVVPVEQKKNDSSFDIRLIPGITNHHKETAMKCWIQDNIHLNLPFWTKEYQLNHGVVVTSYGLMAGTKPVLDFLSVSSIKWEKNTRLKISTIRNEFMYDEIYNNETNVEEINTDEIKKKLSDSASTNVIQCNIFHGEVVIKQVSRPSQQLVKDINDALNNIYPYQSLTKVFSEYGHMICTEITMGRNLECIEWSEWSDTIISKCKDLLKKFNMDDQNLIAHKNSDKSLNEINTLSLADRTKLIPLYEIFDEETKRQIQNLLENKQRILMTEVTKLRSSETRYYRVNFNNCLLTSDDYQVIGSVIVNNKRSKDLSVKFQMKSISGFSIIIKEEHKNLKINGNLEVVWQLIGKPKSVGYFSNHTRNIKVFNKEFEIEIPKQKTSHQIDVEEELCPNYIVATSIQYPPTNYESTLQVDVESWSGKTINLDIKYHMDASDDNTEEDESDQPDKAFVQLYVINPNQQKSVIADFGSGQVLWKFIGHELGPVKKHEQKTKIPTIFIEEAREKIAGSTCFKSRFPDIKIPEIGVYQYITSNPYGIDDDKVIFIDGITDKKLTFGQFKSNSKKLASGLINKVKFKRGDALAIFSHNHIDYPIVIFGAIATGGKVTMAFPEYEEEEFTYQLKDCGASVIISDPKFLDKAIKAAAATNIHKSNIFLFGDKEINGFQPFSSLFSDQEFNPVEYTPEETKSTTAYLCYTSGTTGRNKGVEITHYNMVSNLAQLDVFEDQINHENIFIGVHPFYHIYGLMFLVHFVIHKGALCVVLRKFELETFCRIIQDYKVDIVPTTPCVVDCLVKNPLLPTQYDLSSLKLVISAAASLSRELSDKFVGIYNTLIKQAYGSTETSPFVTLTRTDNIVDASSIGILIPNVECKIISENNQELGYEKLGEFYFRGPNIMKGYLNNKEATDARIDKDGWFRTGDVGYVDPQGNFFFLRRVKESIEDKVYISET